MSKKKRHYLVFFIAFTTLDVVGVGTNNEKDSDICGLQFSIWLLEFLFAFVKVFVCCMLMKEVKIENDWPPLLL